MSGHSALELWRQKLEHLQKEEALAVDPEQKFSLTNRIDEAKAKINELERENTSVELRTNRVVPSRLSHTANRLFGRDDDLARLAAYWADHKTRLVCLVAFGGVGKTSLAAQFAANLADRNYDGADYFDWSFYSQGTRDFSTASADSFIDAALRFFGDAPTAESAHGGWEKGARLAEILASRRALLMLDGLEPLQYPPGPLVGELKDPAMQALLFGLAAKNAGLCVVTTREKVAGLGRFAGAVSWELESLSTADGMALLVSLGLEGSTEELREAVEELRGHALTLHLLGRYLRSAHGGDVRKRDRVGFEAADARVLGGHAFRVMGAYESWLDAAGDTGQRDLSVLYLLGLFDRPASGQCLATLRQLPAIVGLTEPWFQAVPRWCAWFKKPAIPLPEEEWFLSLDRLASGQLVVIGEDGSVDAHPLIREYFANRTRTKNPGSWRAAHGRIFDFLKDGTPQFPETLPALQPLYQAVYHGCQAGRHEETRATIYRDRILRGEEIYSTRKLGAFGADLGAVSCFFEKPWSQLAPSVSEAASAWLLNEAAFRLRALGRLREAFEPMRAAVRWAVNHQRWDDATSGAINLSELELTLGEVTIAVADAYRSVTYSDSSGDPFGRMIARTTLAAARHQAGEEKAALTLFREAERLQSERQPEYQLLYSLGSFQFCELLLGKAEMAAGTRQDIPVPDAQKECAEVERRARKLIDAQGPEDSLLDIALHHLSLSRAKLYGAILEGSEASFAATKVAIDKAVTGLRTAGTLDYLPCGLLTRAWLRQCEGNVDGARADLDEAQEIAERGSMELYLADVALYRARLFHDRVALAEARRLVEECGYGRRLPEIADLEAMSIDWP